jgi:glycosyltransferase involved in cell wall biosynthesis
MTRLVIQASRVTAVHTQALAAFLRDEYPAAHIEPIRLAHGEPIDADRARDARSRVRQRHGIADDAILFGVFGGLTPEKRIPQILDALAAVLPYSPQTRLLLGGAPARHFDAASAVRDRGLERHVTMAGYLVDDEALADYLSACDVSINVRWPTAREVSGPWLRALAAGLPTITTDLAHLADVPSLDPRTWALRPSDPASRIPHPVTVAIDILDEDHSLRLAMRRLAGDATLRAALGASARAYWEREHSMARMLADYRRVLAEAAAAPAPTPTLPAHLVNSGDRTLNDLLRPFAISGVLDTR